MNGYVHLAYGYDLGTAEEPKCGPLNEYDELDLPWWDPEADDLGFEDCVADVLKETGIVGVEVRESGHVDYPGWMLIVAESEKSVEWYGAIVLSLADMEHPPDGAYDLLTSAIEALGIAPQQEGPRWLAFMSYG